jgi:hypothetical protein
MKLLAIAIASGALLGLPSAQAVPLSSAPVIQNQIATVAMHCTPSSGNCTRGAGPGPGGPCARGHGAAGGPCARTHGAECASS